MAVTIKSPREIELMREAGRILAKTHEELAKNLRPGMSTWDIDQRKSSGVTAAFPRSKITTAIPHRSVSLSMMRLYMESRTRNIFSMRETSSVWMQE